MLILHPYSEDRAKDKKETWAFLEQLRLSNLHIIDIEVGRESYADLISRYWGIDDLIILEDDKVPTIDNFTDLYYCNKKFCTFPYPTSMNYRTTMDTWINHFPYGLGFVKFTKEVQLGIPYVKTPKEYNGENWDRSFGNNVDRSIEIPMIKKYGSMHLHETMIKHNHKVKKIHALGNWIYKIYLGD